MIQKESLSLQERLLLALQQQFLAFDEKTKEITGLSSLSDLVESLHDREMIEARVELLGELLSLPYRRIERAMKVIKDHSTADSLGEYQELEIWFISEQPLSLLNVRLAE